MTLPVPLAAARPGCCCRCSAWPTWRPSGAGAARRRRSRRPRVSASVVPAPARLAAPRCRSALAGLATAALIGALARPQVSVAVPAEQATIVLAMDHSGSMMATDVVAVAARRGARTRARRSWTRCPKRVRVGGVVFDQSRRGRGLPDDRPRRAARRRSKAAMKPSGGTATGDALATSLRDDHTRARRRRARSCCSPTARRPTAATRCRSPTRPSSSASRSTPSRSAPPRARCPTATRSRRTRRRCSRSPSAPAAQAFTAEQSDALSAVYEKLGSEVARRRRSARSPAPSPAARRILLLLGGGLSLRWFRRLALSCF